MFALHASATERPKSCGSIPVLSGLFKRGQTKIIATTTAEEAAQLRLDNIFGLATAQLALPGARIPNKANEKTQTRKQMP